MEKDALEKNIRKALQALNRDILKNAAALSKIEERLSNEVDRAFGIKKGDPGHSPVFGVDFLTPEEMEFWKADIIKAATPKKGSDYFTPAEVKEFLDRATPKKGVDYHDGKPGKPGKPLTFDDLTDRQIKALQGDRGPIGPMPRHEWEGTKLRFEKSPGVWGAWKELKGEPGSANNQNPYEGWPVRAGTGATRFIELADVSQYASNAGKVATVNATENGLIFSSLNSLLPSQVGNSGKFLTTNGTTISWGTPAGGGGTPAAPSGSVQFNNGGAFGGDADFKWDSAVKQINIGQDATGDYAQWGLTMFGNRASYYGIHVKNLNTGDTASTDLTVSADNDNASLTGHYIDVGINCSGYIASNSGNVWIVSVGNGGTGYTVGDVLTLISGDNNATVTVLTESGGVIQTVEVTVNGTGYSIVNNVPTTGGTGAGARINVLKLFDTTIYSAGLGYLYNSGGDLAILTDTPGTVMKFALGGYSSQNEVMRLVESTGYMGVGTQLPDAQGHFYLPIVTSVLSPWSMAVTSAPAIGSDYLTGQVVTFRIYSVSTIGGTTYYSTTYYEHGPYTIANDGDGFYIELGGGDGNAHIERDIDGAGFLTHYDVASGSFYDYGYDPIVQTPTVHTPTEISIQTRINYPYAGELYSIYADSKIFAAANIYARSKVLIGTYDPADPSAPLSVTNETLNTEERIAFFESNRNNQRIEFTLANSSGGSWTYNFLSIMNHGASYGSTYYTDNDAGAAIILAQGSELTKLAFATYNSQPIYFYVGSSRKLGLSSSGVTVGADLTISTKNIITDTTTGTKIATATNQKLGFFNATPVVQQGATTDLGTVLSNLGLRAAGTAYPITTSGNVTLNGLTASRAVATDGSKILVSSATTSTELGYLSGVTSALQAQIDAKQATITGGASTIASANLTASRALVSDGSGKVAVATTTAAEVGYLNGVTSGIQAQLDAKSPLGYTLQGVSISALNPVDSTTYYFGFYPFTAPSTTADTMRLYIPKSGTIKGAAIIPRVLGTLGSGESASFYVRLNNTTDLLITTAATFSAIFNYFGTMSLNQAVSAGDYIEFKIITPAWVTNPTTVTFNAVVYIE